MEIEKEEFNHPGHRYKDFLVTHALEVKELQCYLRELTHIPTGAQIMHLANNDPENLFCLSFRTLPYNSNGVAHILEHTVLCGSAKFPVKDPFFGMGRRSLNTFMNALTGSDFTCYPAASQVPKDFYNLLEVYLDAVFHPRLAKLSFLQEGCRMEFAVPTDPTTPLVFKGVVYNEMKGCLASPSTRLGDILHHSMFPDLPYGFNFGGSPKEIPSLTHQQLLEFHKKYYHPSHCLFFFYGNMPLEKHLDFIQKHALNGVQQAAAILPIPLQPRFLAPHYLTVEYPVALSEEENDKTYIAFGWLTAHILQQQEVLGLCVLEIVLMDTDGSPLKLALLKSGLCKLASASIDIEMSEIPVVIALRGCEPENADALEKVLTETLQGLCQKGIPQEMIDNAFHQLEIHRSEITGNHSPFGLSLFMRSALLKQHGGHAENGLVIHELFDQLRHEYAQNPRYFTKLIQRYFLNNPHRVRIVMKPSKELASAEAQEEKVLLEEKRQEMGEEKVAEVIRQSEELVAFQRAQEEEDLDVLPKITLADVSRSVPIFSLHQEKAGNLQVYHHACFTNEIVYADFCFPLPYLSEEELPLIRLLAVLFTQVGCGGRSYVEALNEIQAHTGGIGASVSLYLQAEDHKKFLPLFSLRGKALHRKVDRLFPLMRDFLLSADFTDLERIREILLKQHTALQSSITSQALRYAVHLAASGQGLSSKISDAWYGMEYFWTIQRLVKDLDEQLPILAKKLQELQTRLMRLQEPHLVISSNEIIYEQMKRHEFYGLQHLPQSSYIPWETSALASSKVPSQARIIASPVAFTAHLFKTVSYSSHDAAALSIAAPLMDNLALHRKIREQGGAYGGGASCSTLAGSFYFYSYRDPHVASTLQSFEAVIEMVIKGDFDEEDLEEAKLEIVQGLDMPIAPGSRAECAYGWLREGKTTEVRQAFRDRLLASSCEDVIRAVKQHIVPAYNRGTTVVFAGKELLEKENELLRSEKRQSLPMKSVEDRF